jgi:GNAT superfamily N-acetyltransferase
MDLHMYTINTLLCFFIIPTMGDVRYVTTRSTVRAFSGGIELGYILFSPCLCHILLLEVHKPHRGIGIGTKLVQHAEAKMTKCKTVDVSVGKLEQHQSRPYGFYSKCGYTWDWWACLWGNPFVMSKKLTHDTRKSV